MHSGEQAPACQCGVIDRDGIVHGFHHEEGALASASIPRLDPIKLSYNGRILAKTIFLWAHFSENCLFGAAKVRNFAKMPGKFAKFR